MPDMTPAPRRRPLWRLFIMPALLLVAAVAWSGFWFYAASEVGVRADAWRAQEAKSGRVYDCGKRSVAGFPFRLEVRCDDASVSLVSQTAGAQAPFTARLGEILVIAQVYDPKLLIAEFKAPATLADRGQPPSMKVNWSQGRSSVVGLPAIPQRASIVFDNPSIDRVNGPVQMPLARAKQVELHGRLAEGSATDHPVIETVLQIAGGSVQEVHPLLARRSMPTCDASSPGLKDFSPKPWPERFREIQAAGGNIEIVRSRIQQGDLIAVAAGTLEPQCQRPDRRRIADDGRGHREGDSGARHRQDAGGGRAAGDARSRRARREDAGPQQSVRRARPRRFPGSARSSSRTPMSALPPASTRSAPKRSSKARRRAPSRCASSTARCFSDP